jgi:3-phosphoshikimate 1-carboxyvinyltransferase
MEKLKPARGLVGSARLPGDKSISHRLAILAALAEGTSVIRNFCSGQDCERTLGCLKALGVEITVSKEEPGGGKTIRIQGRGLGGLKPPQRELDAGNSGSTMRMLAGVLAAHPFDSLLTGDESLRRRPMRRLIEPLEHMGAKLEASEGDRPPLRIRGGGLKAIHYTLPVASAQVKTAILLAGLHASGITTVEEPVRTRDHTEIAMTGLGVELQRQGRHILIRGGQRLVAKEFVVPNDLSAAAFFLVGGLLLPATNLTLPGVGLNPTRAALLDFLVGQGAQIRIPEMEEASGELRGTLQVRGGRTLSGGLLEGHLVARLIDELPVLAVLGTQTSGGVRIRDAAELRVKESDRIAALAENLRRLGARVREYPDGLDLPGRQHLRGAEVDSYGDHRLAMALAVAALVAEDETLIRNADCVDVSFPGFFPSLAAVRD